MKNPKDSFFKGRLRSFKFALKGMWLLMSTEDSIKAQLFVYCSTKVLTEKHINALQFK